MTNDKLDPTKNNSRMLGLDILKTISMIFIIIHHLSKHGAFFIHSTGICRIILIIANALFLPSVNIFVFVSAYLIIKKGKVSFKNYIKLYGQIVFYSIITFILACLLDVYDFSFKSFFQNFLPIAYPVFWFAKAYLVMYIISPLLLKIVNQLEKKQYLITIAILLGVSIFTYYSNTYEFLPLSKGFNAIWFAFIFLLAGYQKKFGFNIKKRYWIIIYIISIIFSILSVFKNEMTVDYTYFPVITQTVSLFNLFYNINTQSKACSNIFKFISTCTFGIYLLHDNKYIQEVLYSKILNTHQYNNSPNSMLYFLLFTLIVIAAGIIVEIIRKSLVKIFNICTTKISLKIRKKDSNQLKNKDDKKIDNNI